MDRKSESAPAFRPGTEDPGRVHSPVSRILSPSADLAARVGWRSFLFHPPYSGWTPPERGATNTRECCGRAALPLFCLAPRGVCRASSVTLGAVGSYPTISPLPLAETRGGILSAALSVRVGLHRPGPRFHEARCPVVSGLSSRFPPKRNPRDRPGSGRPS